MPILLTSSLGEMRAFGGVTSEGLGVGSQWRPGAEPLVKGFGVKAPRSFAATVVEYYLTVFVENVEHS